MTTGIIYALTFPNGKIYVGKTTRPLRIRISNHKSATKHHRSCLLAALWLQYGEPKSEVLGTYPIDKLHGAERGWMLKLNTHYPNGLNKN